MKKKVGIDNMLVGSTSKNNGVTISASKESDKFYISWEKLENLKSGKEKYIILTPLPKNNEVFGVQKNVL